MTIVMTLSRCRSNANLISASACGISVNARTPEDVLARKLVEAGHEPDQPVETVWEVTYPHFVRTDTVGRPPRRIHVYATEGPPTRPGASFTSLGALAASTWRDPADGKKPVHWVPYTPFNRAAVTGEDE